MNSALTVPPDIANRIDSVLVTRDCAGEWSAAPWENSANGGEYELVYFNNCHPAGSPPEKVQSFISLAGLWDAMRRIQPDTALWTSLG